MGGAVGTGMTPASILAAIKRRGEEQEVVAQFTPHAASIMYVQLNDLTPENGVVWGEDGVYSDRRVCLPRVGFPKYVVVQHRIFSSLCATTEPRAS